MTHLRPLERTWPAACLTLLLLLAVPAGRTIAYPTFFASRCAPCHSDDTPTCVGCHQHRGNLHVVADLPEYQPGETVTITLTGGTRGGWLRGLLYDAGNVEIDRATGPTGTGDDGLPDPVVFPVQLVASAPPEQGDYVWQAAWFGGNTQGTGHLEVRVPVTIHVAGQVAVPDGPQPATWGRIKAIFD
ncbi:MAG: hypothetical protein PVF43_05735 [Candidatus Eiseniibacteriota bacterium]|jgi:hypothetical protein